MDTLTINPGIIMSVQVQLVMRLFIKTTGEYLTSNIKVVNVIGIYMAVLNHVHHNAILRLSV